MGTIVKWSLIVIIGAVLFAGLSTAAALTHTIFSTGGITTGLLVGGIPDAADGLRQGVAAAQGKGGAKKKNNGTTNSSWTGGTLNNWTGAPAQQQAPAAEKKARPKHPKPNA
jgi:hypothetical protein